MDSWHQWSWVTHSSSSESSLAMVLGLISDIILYPVSTGVSWICSVYVLRGCLSTVKPLLSLPAYDCHQFLGLHPLYSALDHRVQTLIDQSA